MNKYFVEYDPDTGKWYYTDSTRSMEDINYRREVNPKYVGWDWESNSYMIAPTISLAQAVAPYEPTNSISTDNTNGIVNDDPSLKDSSSMSSYFSSPEEASSRYPYPQYIIKMGQKSGSGLPFYYATPNYDYLSGETSGNGSVNQQAQLYNATTGAQQNADRAIQRQQLVQQKAESDMAAKLELAKLQAEPVDWIKAWYANQAMKGNKQNQTYSTPGEMVEATGVPKTAAWAGKTLADYLDANPVTYKELAPLNIIDPSRQETVDQAKELIRVNSAVNDNLNSVIGTTLGNANANLNTDVNNLTGGETGTWAEYLNANSPGQQSRTPQAPKTPDWLKQYAPGIGNKYGEITKVEAPTLSGQQFSAIDPTKLQGLQGYLNWASTFKKSDGNLGGQSYEDMLANMQRMQTKTPIGAGTQSWAATRQRSV